jgi:hypothetical protein
MVCLKEFQNIPRPSGKPLKKYDGPVCYHLMRKDAQRNWVPANQKANGALYFSYPSSFQYQPQKGEKAGPIRYGDLFIDLDSKSNPGLTLIEAQQIISHFQTVFNVDPSQWRIWLSGGKGVHLCLSASTIGSDGGHIYLMRGYKLLMAEVAAALGLRTVDTSIYKQGYGQPFRRENVKRENGRYKVPITYDMLFEEYEDLEQYTHEPQQVENKVVPELEFTIAGKMAELLKVASFVKEVKTTPLSVEQREILKSKVPACISYLITDDSEPDSLCRDFNRISMVLISYCQSVGMDISATLETCNHFIQNYSGSSSCDTPEKRLENLTRRFHSMNGEGYGFDCSFVLGLKCTGSAFDCSKCAMSCFKEAEGLCDLLITGDSVEMQPVQWTWENRIPRGKVTTFTGEGGVSKTLFFLTFAAIVSKGGFLPMNEGTAPQGSTIYISGEDDVKDTLLPRYILAGGDPKKIHFVDLAKVTVDLTNGRAILAQLIDHVGDVVLLVIDPATAFLGDTASHVGAEVQSMLAQLGRLAETNNVTILSLVHFNKDSKANAVHRVAGSAAFVTAARAACACVAKGEDKFFNNIKNNLGKPTKTIQYRVEGVAFDHPGFEGQTVPIIRFADQYSDESIDDLLRGDQKKSDSEDREPVLFRARLIYEEELKSESPQLLKSLRGFVRERVGAKKLSDDECREVETKIGALVKRGEGHKVFIHRKTCRCESCGGPEQLSIIRD